MLPPDQPQPASRARTIAGGVALGLCALVLLWFWARPVPPETAPPQTQSRADEITQKIREKEAPEPPQAIQQPGDAGTGGPTNLRQRPK